MKKTKIIIFTVTVLLIMALPVLLVIQKTKAKNTPELLVKEEYKLPDISVVVTKNFDPFILTSGNENKVIVKYSGDKIKIDKPFSIHNDTLFMTENYTSPKVDVVIQIELKNVDKLIVENSSEVYICNYSSPKLEVINRKGVVLFTYIEGKKREKNRIDSLHYTAYNGLLLIKNTQTKEARIELRKSRFWIMEKMNFKNLRLQVNDSSEVKQFWHKRGNVQNLDLEIDNSSIFQFSEQ